MRRLSVIVLSIVAHAAALFVLLVVPLVATDTLPTPRRIVDYFLPNEVMPIVAQPAQMRAPSPRSPAARVANADSTPMAAPLEAPNGIGADRGADENLGASGVNGPLIEGLVALPGGTVVESAPPPAPPVAPVRLHAGIRPPRKLVDVRPVYPALALAARAEGTVIIEATIDAGGNVTAARILRSHPLLEQAALDAVRQWKYTPTLLNSMPVPVIMTVTISFSLK